MRLTEKEKIERYDQIIGYFQTLLQKREDKLIGQEIYYDEWKQPRYMNKTEREEEVIDDFLSDMDNIGFYDFAELITYEVYCKKLSNNNQFYDHIYGD
jgi:hypothetical protein